MIDTRMWQLCIERLQSELDEQQINTWLRPLQALEDGHSLELLAPNRFILEWVHQNYISKIETIIDELYPRQNIQVKLRIGVFEKTKNRSQQSLRVKNRYTETVADYDSKLNPDFTFDNFIEGNSNQLARAASLQVALNPGKAYNPLFIYGGVGLGKTHLMHAVGNQIIQLNSEARVIYLHSEGFVANMIKALQHNTITNFKRYYRTADALLIDDIQFFARKDRSQEEFFHTFNALLEGRHQVILTSDKYPKEVSGLEERLKSRFGWGLTVAVEPPELETRVAILQKKASQANIELPNDVAFFVAKRICSNVRELEGALRRIIATAQFSGQEITVEFTKIALHDLLSLQDKMATLENIQKTVAEYYKIRVADLLSSRRSRSITRPRQLAMYLAKEFTNHSLPEIGDAFGGRDHTTVIHACKKIRELITTDNRMKEDHKNLVRLLST